MAPNICTSAASRGMISTPWWSRYIPYHNDCASPFSRTTNPGSLSVRPAIAMPLRRSYTDGPSETQKLYGSSLPPSLRWGAARKHFGAQEQQPPAYTNTAAEPPPPIPDYAPRRTAHTNRDATDGTREFEVRERKRRPYAIRSASRGKAKRLLLQGTPEQDRDNATDPSNRRRTDQSVSEWLEMSKAGDLDTEELAVARIGRKNTDKTGTRTFHYTEDKVRKNSGSDTNSSVVAGAENPDNATDGLHAKHQAQRPEQAQWPDNGRGRSIRSQYSAKSGSPVERTKTHASERSYYSISPQRASGPWYQQRWSARPTERHIMQDAEVHRKSPLSQTIVTELSCDSTQIVEVGPATPSAYQRVRSWGHNYVFPATEQSKLTLKRVVHATYGDFLQDEMHKGTNPSGFIAVPQSCGFEGDTLYHIL